MLSPDVSHEVVPPRPVLLPTRTALDLAAVAPSQDAFVLAPMVSVEVLPRGEARVASRTCVWLIMVHCMFLEIRISFERLATGVAGMVRTGGAVELAVDGALHRRRGVRGREGGPGPKVGRRRAFCRRGLREAVARTRNEAVAVDAGVTLRKEGVEQRHVVGARVV
jgi:predicted Rdx family selenoprotein